MLGFGTLLSRAFYLQLFHHEKLEKLKKRQFETFLRVNSQRGSIWDYKGKELAVTFTSYSLYANPQHIQDPYGTAKKLSPILKMSFRKIYRKFSRSKKSFVWLKRSLSKLTKKKIQKLKIKGLNFVEEPKRFYPSERLLSQVIGFVGQDSRGLEGLEFKYNKHLEGPKRKIHHLRDAKGRPLLLKGYFLTKDRRGSSLHLTIDSELQFVLEQELEKTVLQYQAKSAMGVILNAQNSEVLAMANIPSYDLNNPFVVSPFVRRNRVITDSFEPGSTVKTFIVASGLEEGLIKPSTLIDCENGQLQIGKHTIHEAAQKRYKFLNVSDILRFSSNIGAAKIAFRLGDKKVRETFENFGFSQLTGLRFTGETRGVLQRLPWSRHLLSNVSFGQGMSATALQVANAYAVIANGGLLKTPKIVKYIETDKKKKVDFKTLQRRVISSETAGTLRLMLTESAPLVAYVKGFPVAGKTGTSQKVDFKKGGYKKAAYISSFAGFIPAYKPKFVIYIVIDEPQKSYYGSLVAAPVFARVATHAVQKAGLTPILIGEENIVKSKKTNWNKGLQKRALNKLLKKALEEKEKKHSLSYWFEFKRSLSKVKGDRYSSCS